MASKIELNRRGVQRFGLGWRYRTDYSWDDDARERMLAETNIDGGVSDGQSNHHGTATIGNLLNTFNRNDNLYREFISSKLKKNPKYIYSDDSLSLSMTKFDDNKNLDDKNLAVHVALYRSELQFRFDVAVDARYEFTERLVMFWSNHFCISAQKSRITLGMAGVYEREAIRPHVFGRFSDMLLAVVSHPAMLDFLDNRQSAGPNSEAGRKRQLGINENLAREILELHTLGVAGGYTQADIESLALILTGWTIVGYGSSLGIPGCYAFDPDYHEPGSHSLLGLTFRHGGREQGVAALDAISRHVATARWVSYKLAKYFVSDRPPTELVDHLTDVFLKSDGNLGEVSRALLNSNIAWKAPATKIRSPQEFLFAACRLFDIRLNSSQIIHFLLSMGQPLWQPSSPKGFSDTVHDWLSAGGILNRIDVANYLAREVNHNGLFPNGLKQFLNNLEWSPESIRTISRAESISQAIAIAMMCPEFQRR